MMTPKLLTIIGVLIMAASSAVMAFASSSSAAPAGAIAEDTITTTVGEAASGILPITGAQLGLLVGVGLLLVSLGWYLVSRRKNRELVTN